MRPPFLLRIGLWFLGLLFPVSWEMALICSACGKAVDPDNVEAHDRYFHPEKP